MFDQIVKFFSAPDMSRSQDPAAETRLAVGALLVEAARSDGTYLEGERHVIAGLLRRIFLLGDAEAMRLVGEAEKALDRSVQLFRFTQQIVERIPPEQRVAIIELLWETVYADRVLTADEDSLVRQVAGLLYVTDRDRGAARLRVLKRLGIPE